MSTTKKIIVLDHKEEDAAAIHLTFKQYFIPSEIINLIDGTQLIELLEKESALHFQYLIVNLETPNVGIHLLKRLKEDAQWKRLPVIIFSASADIQHILNCYAIGANAYVVKPVDSTAFQQAVKAIAEFWGEVNVKPLFI